MPKPDDGRGSDPSKPEDHFRWTPEVLRRSTTGADVRDPEVTVIVPLFQTAAHVGAAIDSILAQTFEDFEVIVVDDGSTDGGLEIARERAARDSRVTVICQEHAGAGAARNTGLDAAAGRFIAFLDSDDLWLEHKLERQLPFMRQGVVIHSDAYVLLERGEAHDERYHDLNPVAVDVGPLDAMLARNQVAFLTAVVPRELLVEHGGFDPLASPCEDYDLWLRLAAAGIEFAYLPEPLAAYRVRGGSHSSDPIRNNTARIRMFTKLEAMIAPNRRKAVRARIRRERRLLAAELMVRGWSSAVEGDLEHARRDLTRAIRAAPTWWRPLAVAAALRLPAGRWRCAGRGVPRQDGVSSRPGSG